VKIRMRPGRVAAEGAIRRHAGDTRRVWLAQPAAAARGHRAAGTGKAARTDTKTAGEEGFDEGSSRGYQAGQAAGRVADVDKHEVQALFAKAR
jgi:hypothetical protein